MAGTRTANARSRSIRNPVLILAAVLFTGAGCGGGGGDGGTNPPEAPTVVSAVAVTATSVRVVFSANVLASSVLTNGSQFTFNNGLVATAATVDGDAVLVTTSAQTGSTSYTVTVATTVKDLEGTPLGTPNSAMFSGFVTIASLRINEVNANVTGGCDLIELRVIIGGSIQGFVLRERTGGAGELNFALPNMTVARNDLIVVHLNSGSATCNQGGATDETTGPNQFPASGNYAGAFDFWASDAGLVSTDNVLTILDPHGTIVEALFVSNDPAGATTSAATETAAAAVGAAAEWSPAMVSYLDAVFRQNAVDDLDATGTIPTGNSIQRLDDDDNNTRSDWTTGAGSPSTFGVLNSGQTTLPIAQRRPMAR